MKQPRHGVVNPVAWTRKEKKQGPRRVRRADTRSSIRLPRQQGESRAQTHKADETGVEVYPRHARRPAPVASFGDDWDRGVSVGHDYPLEAAASEKNSAPGQRIPRLRRVTIDPRRPEDGGGALPLTTG